MSRDSRARFQSRTWAARPDRPAVPDWTSCTGGLAPLETLAMPSEMPAKGLADAGATDGAVVLGAAEGTAGSPRRAFTTRRSRITSSGAVWIEPRSSTCRGPARVLTSSVHPSALRSADYWVSSVKRIDEAQLRNTVCATRLSSKYTTDQ